MLQDNDYAGIQTAQNKGMSPQGIQLAMLLSRLHRRSMTEIVELMHETERDCVIGVHGASPF